MGTVRESDRERGGCVLSMETEGDLKEVDDRERRGVSVGYFWLV